MLTRPVGPQPAIPQSLWPELQQLDRQRVLIEDVVAWLETHHGIKVSRATVSRTLAKVRAAAPPPPPVVLAPAAPDPVPPLDYATEEDELVALRADIRRDLRSADWKQRHSAANLLCKLLAESRARRDRPAPSRSSGDQECHADPQVPSVLFTAAPSHKGSA